MAFITKGALISSREQNPDYTIITEEHGGMDDKRIIWDSRSGLPDPDAEKPYVEASWKQYDTPTGYASDGTYGVHQTMVIGENGTEMKTVWDSRIDGIPEEWRVKEAQRRATYDASVEYARQYRLEHPDYVAGNCMSSSADSSSCSSSFSRAASDVDFSDLSLSDWSEDLQSLSLSSPPAPNNDKGPV